MFMLPTPASGGGKSKRGRQTFPCAPDVRIADPSHARDPKTKKLEGPPKKTKRKWCRRLLRAPLGAPIGTPRPIDPTSKQDGYVRFLL